MKSVLKGDGRRSGRDNNIKSVLKGESCWAERDKYIKENSSNTGVHDDTYKLFINLLPSKSRDELILDFSAECDLFINAKSGASKILARVPSIPRELYDFNVEKGNALLKMVIEHPELSEREQYLLSLVKKGKGEELKATAEEFESLEIDHCPKCHQLLTVQYKTDLITSIKKVLSEKVKIHQRKLAENELLCVDMDLSPFQQLHHYKDCVNAIDCINQIIQTNNSLLKTKESDPYTPIQNEMTSIEDALSKLNITLQHLEKDLEAYNRSVADVGAFKKKLTRINNEIAYYDVIDLFRKYEKRLAEKEAADELYKKAQITVIEKQNLINELNSHRENIHIAIDVINDAFKYIFFSENRMKIHVEDGVYKLFINGNAVKPKDVSVGERNIIGLCYFFTNILHGKSNSEAYDEEYILVIDDPVSSYDLENKVGILSFLKYQLGKFLLGNINTRTLLLTHDLMTAIDVGKIFRELGAAFKDKFNGKIPFSVEKYELLEHHFVKFKNDRNEYTELLKLIYEYGKGELNDQEPYIGNIIRQVIEAFATFEYKKDPDSVSTDDSILDILDREEDKIHYKNLMYRIVLNEGSHRYDQTRNMHMDYFAFISEPEKRRTAKEILCFMFLLNKPHINAHLGEKNCRVIESWCDEIRGH